LRHIETLLAAGAKSSAILSDWGCALYQLGRIDEAGAAFAQAIAQDPKSPTALAHLGHWLADHGDTEAASRRYAEALALAPRHAIALLGRGELTQSQTRPLQALGDFETALAANPGSRDAFMHLVQVLIELGRIDDALVHVTRLLKRNPSDCGALAILAVLERERGNFQLADELLDLDALVFEDWLDPPADGTSLEHLCHLAAEHVTSHTSLIRSPRSHATVAGGHTGELLMEPKGPIGEIESQLEARLRELFARLPETSAHPWLEHRPTQITINAWGVVLTEGGHQVPHIHPEAWLSGVLYVALPVPPATGGSPGSSGVDSEYPGWLEFGTVDPRLAAKEIPKTRFIRPELGKLVLFPSFFYHRTVAFSGPGQRVSIAFDVIPLETNTRP